MRCDLVKRVTGLGESTRSRLSAKSLGSLGTMRSVMMSTGSTSGSSGGSSGSSGSRSSAKPRNPRHFDGIRGGRKRVPDTLLTKTVFGRGAQPRFHTLFGVKTLSEHQQQPGVSPRPATHWASLQLKAGETDCKTPIGSKTV